jgi:ABC-2 type transport system ATP-binding protein
MNDNAKLAIEAQGLVKRYGEEVLAVDGVDLSIPSNTIYAMLGPNACSVPTGRARRRPFRC